MSTPNRPVGRPRTGTRFPRRLMVYESDKGIELVQALADKWETTGAEVIRRLIREKAAEEGITATREEA